MDPLWADLINSDWRDHRGGGVRADRIGDDRWLARFLARAGWSGRRLPEARDRRRLRTLRAVLRRAVEALRGGGMPAPRDVAALNRVLARCPEARWIAAGADGRLVVRVMPVGRGIERVLATVAGSFADFLAHGDPGRIRVCANPDCGWVFLDSSRSRTRRWCEAAVCGSLVNVRRFRERRRDSPHRPRA